MVRKNQSVLRLLDVLCDVVLVFIAYLIAIGLRFDVLPGRVSIPMNSLRFVVIAAAYSFLVAGGYAVCRVYETDRYREAGSRMASVLGVNTVGTLVLMALLYVFRAEHVSRLALLMFFLISSALVIGKHLVQDALTRTLRARGYNLKHVVVVGNGALARQYIEEVRSKPELGISVDGYVSAVEKPDLGKPMGAYEDLEKILQDKEFDTLVVALEPHEIAHMKQVLMAAEKEGIRLEMIPFYNELYPAHPVIESIGKTKLVDLRATPLDNVLNAFIKRSFDLVASLVLIVVLSPLMLLIALGVQLSSPGPVLFAQERIGRNKKPFRMLKFRSMRQESDPNGWTTDADGRKTFFGSLIRKFSLDELPQLFNVVTGSMSLVGPRPEIPFFVRRFKEEIPLYLVRQQVRPGMTGWAQVNGLRGDTSIEDRVVYDIYYIENWSFAMDIRILVRTLLGGMVNNEVVSGAAGRKRNPD